MSSLISKWLTMPSAKVILFGVIGVVLVSATTALVSHEYESPRKRTTSRNNRSESTLFNNVDTDDEWNEDKDNEEEQENINVLHLLYTIAQDQAHLDGFVHRGISCNKCHEEPIRGIRYHCLNCIDYDVCEYCENEDTHYRTHTMIKIRVPAPSLVRRRPIELPMYPGRMLHILPPTLDISQYRHLKVLNLHDQAALESLYEQFRCLANAEWKEDPMGLGAAIDRDAYAECLAYIEVRSNIIFDKMFEVYDTDKNGLIGFQEFVTGIHTLKKDQKRKLQLVFEGYDSDHDGIITREDVTAMFTAMWSISQVIIETTIRSDEEHFQNEQADTTRQMTYASTNSLTNRMRHRADASYPLSATFYYPPPSGSDFIRTDAPIVNGDNAPEEIILASENIDPHGPDAAAYDAASYTRMKLFEEMERVIDEIFEGGLAETGINFEQFRELAVGPHGKALMGWIDMLRTVF